MTEEPRHTIRLAGRQELDAVAELVREAFAPFEEVLPRHIFEPYLKESSDFSARLADRDVAVLLRGDRLVGTVSYYADAAREDMGWASGLAGLRTLAVAPSAQGHGLGRALCEWCIARARHQGAPALVLHTAAFMTSACRLYERLGFKRRSEHDLLASTVLGFEPARGDQRILAYLLPLQDVPSIVDRP